MGATASNALSMKQFEILQLSQVFEKKAGKKEFINVNSMLSRDDFGKNAFLKHIWHWLPAMK